MAHLPHGSAQTECVRLPYDAPPLSCGHICQRTVTPQTFCWRGKGKPLHPAGRLSLNFNDSLDQPDF